MRRIRRQIDEKACTTARSTASAPTSPTRTYIYTQQLGIGNVLVAAKVDFVDTVSAADVEAACGLAEQRLRAALPTIRHVFLDPTGASS
ncbi:MAG TPA: hypothetical protein DGG94_19850 [Micromonosporaceae bacterium]|nr:hypothetical protein [Micromonosporaceae bacterium]